MAPSLEYLAGFFDGEGCVGIYRSGNTGGRTLKAQLTQVISPASTLLLKSCQERWGGSLSEMRSGRLRRAWNWQVGGKGAAVALADLRPHLLLKAGQVDVALTWWATRPAVRPRDARGRVLPFTEAEHAADLTAEAALKALKAA